MAFGRRNVVGVEEGGEAKKGLLQILFFFLFVFLVWRRKGWEKAKNNEREINVQSTAVAYCSWQKEEKNRNNKYSTKYFKK